jgi:hypothetical protein
LLTGICGLIGLGISGYASILSSTIAVSGLILLIISAVLSHTPYEYITSAVLGRPIPYEYITFGVLNLAIIFYALRPNFAALRAGTERKIGQKNKNIVQVSQRTDEV